MSAAAPPKDWRRITNALLAIVFLNGMLSFRDWWPTPGVLPDHRLSPEFVWVWLALLAVVAWRGALSRRSLNIFTFVFLLLVLGRYGDVTVPSLFGRPINLYWDGANIPRFLWVSAQEKSGWQSAAIVAIVGVLFWGLFRLLRAVIAVTARDAVPYALRSRLGWAMTSLAVLLAVANQAGASFTWPLVAKPVIPSYWRQVQLLAAAFSPQHQAALLPATTAVDTAMAAKSANTLGALGGRDVYLIMLESVGAITYDDAHAARTLGPSRERFAADIAASGRHVVTAFFRSPTFAGGSDLAQLGVLSGIDLSDPMRHDLLLTTQRPTLISLFKAQGYQTFGLYPALNWEWPERAFYGFDVFLERRDLGYAGPAMGFWELPDQFTAARFEKIHPRDNGAPPRFVFFPTITCHLPFSPVPPYQAEWSRVLSAQPFDEAETHQTLAQKPNWLNMAPDYLRMVNYTYQWLGAYFRQPEPREAIYVLVGDHQPAANITGEGASWDVPVHIVSRDSKLLGRFIEQGFRPGMEPPRQAIGALHALTGMMLESFAAPAAQSLAKLAPLPGVVR
ncbi:MAG: sulfatase-like hydrolase/transferase [Betaproteobacteria bacterium]|nr:sulfatase-like hydrolase/transferase [Betaproteobacteria bacterium]